MKLEKSIDGIVDSVYHHFTDTDIEKNFLRAALHAFAEAVREEMRDHARLLMETHIGRFHSAPDYSPTLPEHCPALPEKCFEKDCWNFKGKHSPTDLPAEVRNEMIDLCLRISSEALTPYGVNCQIERFARLCLSLRKP